MGLHQFLAQTAKRGSWYGGGSAAALTCALAAALLEKLAGHSKTSRSLRAIRSRCARLIEEDARAFARVIRAYDRHDQPAITQALRTAIEIPAQIQALSGQLRTLASSMATAVPARYRVDLRCAMALARASGDAARLLVKTNREWLGGRAHSRRALHARARRS